MTEAATQKLSMIMVQGCMGEIEKHTVHVYTFLHLFTQNVGWGVGANMTYHETIYEQLQ